MTVLWTVPSSNSPVDDGESWGVMRSWGWSHCEWISTLHFSLSCIGEGNGNPIQCSCLENPRNRGAWWAAVSGVTQSRTQLKQLSSSSRSSVLWIYVFSSLGYTPRNEIAQSHGNSVLQFLTNCQLFSKGHFKTFPQAVYNAFSFSTSLLIFLLALAFLMGVKYTLLWFWYAFP